ncbi:hypothetical protein ACFLQZ_01675 [Acidobacteriota bacterium]
MEPLFWILLVIPFFLVILGLLIWSLVWVHGDAIKRGKPGWPVVFLVLLLEWPISLLVWIVFRPEIKEPQLPKKSE